MLNANFISRIFIFRNELKRISSKQKLAASLLPIRSVGVQGDCRTYSYVVGISSEKEPDWNDMKFLSSLIPKICHNVNRVCYIFGGIVKESLPDVTPTYLTSHVLSTLRQCDDVAMTVSLIFYFMSTVVIRPDFLFTFYLSINKILSILEY